MHPIFVLERSFVFKAESDWGLLGKMKATLEVDDQVAEKERDLN